MVDRLTPERRSWLMSRVRSKHTKPEMIVRRAAHALGLRFRLHRKDLSGRPDLVFPRHKVALFVQGCFWHRHPGCRLASTPKTRTEFWQAKFDANVARDARVADELRAAGWRVVTIWECETRKEEVLSERLAVIEDLVDAHDCGHSSDADMEGAPMATDGDGTQGANALPSKRFFVNMLVRDIELKDAILDLLDNCVDGILRSRRPDLSQPKPYAGCRATIALCADGFKIADNCGGIPFQVAKDKAFAIGNPDPITGEDAVATVGMYGIGMKRAIFKFGESALVRSYSDIPFEVRIDRGWLGNDAWSDLPMTVLPETDFAEKGTMVEVRDLYPPVAAEFGRDSFVDDVRDAIARQYSIILGKGFEVSIARQMDAAAEAVPVEAEKFELLVAPDDGRPHIAPYVYKGEIDGVTVEIYAGLYRELPDETEQEEAEETSGSADDAGWVVACNDRVVIWKDRSRLTGWGEAGTPNFHGQFIAITGIVLMHSTDPSLLPLTTTKRGVDAGSEVYSKAKDLMRTATQGLASFTNKWKKFPADLDQLYLKSETLDLPTLQTRTPAMRAVHNMPTMLRAAPTLPVPAAIATDARISFAAPKTKVAHLAEIYFGDRNAKASKVGEHAFHQEYARLAEAAE